MNKQINGKGKGWFLLQTSLPKNGVDPAPEPPGKDSNYFLLLDFEAGAELEPPSTFAILETKQTAGWSLLPISPFVRKSAFSRSDLTGFGWNRHARITSVNVSKLHSGQGGQKLAHKSELETL